jgi:hypothetical protein
MPDLTSLTDLKRAFELRTGDITYEMIATRNFGELPDKYSSFGGVKYEILSP